MPTPLVFLGLAALLACIPGCGGPTDPLIAQLREKGLAAEAIEVEAFARGEAPRNFAQRAGARYRPSFNEDPAIPAQCWIETGYGTQNACLYCHTDYLAGIGHGNAFPLGEDQVLYSFPSPALNSVLWRNVIAPQEIEARLRAEGVALPGLEETDWVRVDNWGPAFRRARANGNTEWMNTAAAKDDFALFPALDPAHLFPYTEKDPTSGGAHGYLDPDGFVRDEKAAHTGWRAVNFFPYGIFTPMTGSVSGIYVRLPRSFRTRAGQECIDTYKGNLDLLERNIKNRPLERDAYLGEASHTKIKKGFFPLGTEFAHPLHYVDLAADGEAGTGLDGVKGAQARAYEFPGTRSRRVKEMRYMYKWKEVGLEDIAESEEEQEFVVGREGQGWVENSAGWILSAFIENRGGDLRPQTTEELMQCIGCHGKSGNTIDSVWSFPRKLPGALGWGEMDYGRYDSGRPSQSRLQDYLREGQESGEFAYFLHTVIGADLYGVMPGEVAGELARYGRENDLRQSLGLTHPLEEIFDDESLKDMGATGRKSLLLARQAIMRHYASSRDYLRHDPESGNSYIKGVLLYPSEASMKANIQLYRMIVLDQSFNLGKDVFGSEPAHVPFTFRSDGTVLGADRRPFPVGAVISSRPFDEEGVGVTPTGLVAVNANGEAIDAEGNPVDLEKHPERAVGHVRSGGTFDSRYNPILGDEPVRK